MFVAPWTAKDFITLPEINSISLWVKFKNIPTTLYSIFGIEWIASRLEEPMLSHMLGEAKVKEKKRETSNYIHVEMSI